MAFGNILKKDLVNICQDIDENIIIQAIEHIKNSSNTHRDYSTHFITYKEVQYPLKYVLEIANNIILNNDKKIGPKTSYTEDTWTAASTLLELIPNPQQITITTPYNEAGQIFVNTLRQNLLEYAISLGLTVNEQPKQYTALKFDNNNIVEVHYVQKKPAKFKILIQYEELNEKLKKNCKKVPDSYGWKLNGEYWINSERTLNEAIEKILYILTKQVNQDTEIPNGMEQMNTKSNQPLNQILYGPPGTGKTYNTVVKAMEIVGLKELFQNWYMQTSNAQNKDKTFRDYCNAIEKLDMNFKIAIFHMLDKNIFEELKSEITNSEYFVNEYKHATSSGGTSYYDSALNQYGKFLNWLTYEHLKNKFDELKQLGQIEFVTFHQSYSYEEFVEGIKPDLNSEDKLTYELKDGIFKKICSDAQTTIKIEKNFDQIYDQLIKDLNSSKKLLILTTPNGSEFGIKTNKKNNLKIYTGENFDRNSVGVITKDYLQNEIFKNGRKCYVQGILDYLNEHYKLNMQTTKNTNKYILIIDEINRGNISKIFGELITLIEEDKRESLSLKLPYSQDPFTVPKNLYIIGTMNTSDRSIASIDIALRRRFTFKEMMPDATLIDEKLEIQDLNIQDIFKTLNERISVLLDRDHQIGHSYFMNLKADKDLETNFKQVWFDCIIPLLNEYFYGDWDKLQALLGKAQDNGESFIKKLSQVKFATDYTCDEDETFDFTPQKDIDFSKALKNAFETKKDEQEEK